jgi:hypothetical protein
MSNEFARNVVDSNLTGSVTLPAAGATSFTSAVDLGAGVYKSEKYEVDVSVPATSAHTSGTLTVSLVNGSTTAPTTDLGLSFTIASSTGGGSATSKRFRLPSDTLRYIRTKIVSSSATDGDCTGVSVTSKLVF